MDFEGPAFGLDSDAAGVEIGSGGLVRRDDHVKITSFETIVIRFSRKKDWQVRSGRGAANRIFCLDRMLLGSESLEVNALETFRAAQPEIQFRTV